MATSTPSPTATGTADAARPTPARRLVIEARPGWILVDTRALYDFRDLLSLMILRDLKARYKQSVLGPFWAVLSPLVSMVLFTIVFGGIAKMSSDGLPYPIFSFAALVPWGLFTTSVTSSANSLVLNVAVIKKVYFPRLYVPLAGVAVALIDFAVAFCVLLLLMFAMGFYPGWRLVWLPVLLLVTLMTALGVGLWLAALMVLFRDIAKLTGYFVTAWLYLTPIVYPRSQIESRMLSRLYDLNPMTAVVEGFRWALLGTPTGPTPYFAAGAGIAVFLFLSGLMVFNRMEKVFADVA